MFRTGILGLLLVGCGGMERASDDVVAPSAGGMATMPLEVDAGQAGGGAAGGEAISSAGGTAGGMMLGAGAAGGFSGSAGGQATVMNPCTQGLSGSRDRTVTIMHLGLTRTANVHLPAGWNGQTPRAVVLNFHGRNSTATQQNLLSGMNTLSDRAGFIAVHPQGVSNTWNAGLCCGEAQTRRIDDVGFVRALLDSLQGSLCIDSKRVYATGLSNGGFISHRLGCELSDRIAAIAPVAGTNLTTPCTPGRAVPVLHVHGTADTIVPYAGIGGIASVDDTMDGWARRNGCAMTKTPLSTRGSAVCEQWTGCRQGARVQLCRVMGGGHQWPGGFTIPGLGSNTMELDASAEAWSFFQQHALP
jgi:polyhydroxybutyrate depolymerase